MAGVAEKRVFITGGAGFIGSNLAYHHLQMGSKVAVFDDFSRKGTPYNARWLRQEFSSNLCLVKGNVSHDVEKLRTGIRDADIIFHCAGQVAVTTSIQNPRLDFSSNLVGSFNILDIARRFGHDPILLYPSTNKVYGGMDAADVQEQRMRYALTKHPLGIPEGTPLDFHSPYGCSKGAADQYFRDYARIYGLKTVIFRQSCIYGYRQFGIEDQGWVAWFIIAHLLGKGITVYGNGKQVRDILFIDDLLRAYDVAVKNIRRTAGQVYNIGGGPKNKISLLELVELIGRLTGKKVIYRLAPSRQGDQKIYVSDISKAKKHFGWQPETGVHAGIARLLHWIEQHMATIKEVQ